MIESCADADTEQLFVEEKSRRFNAIARVALRKEASKIVQYVQTAELLIVCED